MANLSGKSLSMSFKKSKEKTNIKHNQRDYIPENVDPNRQHLNVAMKHGDPREEYKDVFGDSLNEYNAKQKRKDRKINDYYSHTLKSGKSNAYEEFIIGLGSREDWDNATEDEIKEGVAVVTEMVEAFNENNPNFHLINADVHGDEHHPHAHVIVVPVAVGYKNGLNKQPSLSKALEQQGYSKTPKSKAEKETKDYGFTKWRGDQMEIFEGVALKHGIKRKLVGTNGYETQEHFIQAKEAIKDEFSKESGVIDLREMLLKQGEREIQEKKEEVEKEEMRLKEERRNWEVEKKRQVDEEVSGFRAEIQAKYDTMKNTFKVRTERFNTVVDWLPVHNTVKNAFKNFIIKGVSGFVDSKTRERVPMEKYQKIAEKEVKEGHVLKAVEQAELNVQAIDDDLEL